MTNKVAKLFMSTANNNNKYYFMEQVSPDEFVATYGRIDKTRTVARYSMSRWNSKYNEKIRKGYRDKTDLFMEEERPQVVTADITGEDTTGLLRKLQSFARGSIRRNYSVSSEKVTQAQVDEAQEILNELAGIVRVDGDLPLSDVKRVNRYLLDLYHTVPRLMANTKDHLLIPEGFVPEYSAKRLVADEQDNIDVMAQQVSSQTRASTTTATTLNITVRLATDDELTMIRNKTQGQDRQVVRAYKVDNKVTGERYASNMNDMIVRGNVHTKEDMFWHGSRNENWLSIVDMGLLIRPTGVLTTGSMFGDGIYFADKFQKSRGYTSARGSYWASGMSDRGFMALFKVQVGKQYQLSRHESWCYGLSRHELRRKGDYDSIFANSAQGFLLNSEYVVYDPSQATIAFLAEIT